MKSQRVIPNLWKMLCLWTFSQANKLCSKLVNQHSYSCKLNFFMPRWIKTFFVTDFFFFIYMNKGFKFTQTFKPGAFKGVTQSLGWREGSDSEVLHCNFNVYTVLLRSKNSSRVHETKTWNPATLNICLALRNNYFPTCPGFKHSKTF